MRIATEQAAANVLTATDLRLADTVDTTSAAHREAIACLRRFFTKKLDQEEGNDYWYTPDLECYGGLYSELLYAEYDSIGDLRYRPTLLAVEPTGHEEQLLMKVAWADDTHAPPKYVFEFLVRPTSEGVRLALPIEHNTRHWERRTVGVVTYIISPQHVFKETEASEQHGMIDHLSAFFSVQPFRITYYSFAGPSDLYLAKGFHQHPLMHTITSGGMVDGRSNVYSGNDRDIYTHEVVHLFSHHKTAEPPPLLEEGLATLIGGSVERDYLWHRANLQHYLAADPALDLRDRCNTYERDDINKDTRVPYVIGAVLCEHILRREGKDALFHVMAAGTDPWPALAEHGITKENLTAELRKELALAPFLIAVSSP